MKKDKGTILGDGKLLTPRFRIDWPHVCERRPKDAKINATSSIWYPRMKEVRQTPRFKEFAREIGFFDYWSEFGWPDLCRPLGDDDFECD